MSTEINVISPIEQLTFLVSYPTINASEVVMSSIAQ